MKAVLQRVSAASVSVNSNTISKIDLGLLILLGIEKNDNDNDIDYLINKIINLRIFNDHDNNMNLSIKDVKGKILVVSQFTLCANTKKGQRPSYINAARPSIAEKLYLKFSRKLKSNKIPTYNGQFGATMEVNIINDGPVTILLNTNKN